MTCLIIAVCISNSYSILFIENSVEGGEDDPISNMAGVDSDIQMHDGK
jgi:hypothetical protein